jgi:hypothetical protein
MTVSLLHSLNFGIRERIPCGDLFPRCGGFVNRVESPMYIVVDRDIPCHFLMVLEED